ncbi:Uncharacterised protein [Mycobacterium tuberculosis]|nr:Uncharacterised protein [Mycobacterium tuberculosis]
MPSRNDSVPMMCDTTALTSQPGSGLVACQSVSSSPSSSASRECQTANSPASTSDLSSVVRGRPGVVTK